MAKQSTNNSFASNSINLFKKYQKSAFGLLLGFGVLITASANISAVALSPAIDSTILFIDEAQLIQSPQPDGTTVGDKGLSIYGDKDYSLTVKDPRLATGGKTAICNFRIREVSATDADANKGYEKLSSTILSSTTTGANYDSLSKSYRVPYDATNGANIKIVKSQQKFTDYNLEIRCVINDSTYGRDQKINFLFGAYSVVDISGVAN